LYSPPTPSFTDVDPAFWGYGWIESLYAEGYTAGCGTDPLLYCPLRNPTRAEGSVSFRSMRTSRGNYPGRYIHADDQGTS